MSRELWSQLTSNKKYHDGLQLPTTAIQRQDLYQKFWTSPLVPATHAGEPVFGIPGATAGDGEDARQAGAGLGATAPDRADQPDAEEPAEDDCGGAGGADQAAVGLIKRQDPGRLLYRGLWVISRLVYLYSIDTVCQCISFLNTSASAIPLGKVTFN